MDALIGAILGAIIGSILAGVVSWRIATRQRKQVYYAQLVEVLEAHNWYTLSHELDWGLDHRRLDPKVSAVCFQNINLLFRAWLNRSIIADDGSIWGWKNFADAIAKGARRKENSVYRECYLEILKYGDVYPAELAPNRWARGSN